MIWEKLCALKLTYLDFNASAPIEQSVKNALLSFFVGAHGNPSSVHGFGRRSKALVDGAREQVAQAIGANDSEEVVFTGSATESINWALKGFARRVEGEGRKAKFVSSGLEHEATLGTLRYLSELGHEVAIVPPAANGSLDPSALFEAIGGGGPDTLLSLMAAQNETGIILPWSECFRRAKELGCSTHLDGVQALGKVAQFSLSAETDLASFSAHKLGGPTGVGALFVRRGFPLVSLFHGGAQERKRRAGTLNVAGILGFGTAASLGWQGWQETRILRDQFEADVARMIPGTQITGQSLGRLPNTSHLLFDDVRGEALMMSLDLGGFAVSSGSACNSGSLLPSPTLLAMGWDKEAALSAVRVSLGPSTSADDMAAFLHCLSVSVERIRQRKRDNSAHKALTKSAASS
jgi:cysteine desulfurase